MSAEIPQCPHDPDDPQAYLTCPPCQKGNHVVAQEAPRMTTEHGRMAKMVTSETCFASGRGHLIQRGETGVYIKGEGWCCIAHGRPLL